MASHGVASHRQAFEVDPHEFIHKANDPSEDYLSPRVPAINCIIDLAKYRGKDILPRVRAGVRACVRKNPTHAPSKVSSWLLACCCLSFLCFAPGSICQSRGKRRDVGGGAGIGGLSSKCLFSPRASPLNFYGDCFQECMHSWKCDVLLCPLSWNTFRLPSKRRPCLGARLQLGESIYPSFFLACTPT